LRLKHSGRAGRICPRAERYWQLLAVINGWPPVPTTMLAWRWTIDALRARTGT
jgi:hypothetical protein